MLYYFSRYPVDQRNFLECKTRSSLGMTIPTVRTSFIGRAHEIAGVRRSLRSARLVTLTGVAGCGKTRLALRAIEDGRDRFVDGVYWVDLARLTDPQFVLPAVARALNVSESSGRSLQAGLMEWLQDKSLLVVFDNCEHLLGACARLVESLLEAPGLRDLLIFSTKSCRFFTRADH